MRILSKLVVGAIVIGAAGLLAPAADGLHVVLDGSSYSGAVRTRTQIRVKRSGFQWPAELPRSGQIVSNRSTGPGYSASLSFSGGNVSFSSAALGGVTVPLTERPGQDRYYDFTVASGLFADGAATLVTTTAPAIGTTSTVVIETIDGVGLVRGDWSLDTVMFRHRFRFTGTAPYQLLPKDSAKTRRFKGKTSISGVLPNSFAP